MFSKWHSARLALFQFGEDGALDAPSPVSSFLLQHVLCPLFSLRSCYSLEVPQLLPVSRMQRTKDSLPVGCRTRIMAPKRRAKFSPQAAFHQRKNLRLRSLRDSSAIGCRPSSYMFPGLPKHAKQQENQERWGSRFAAGKELVRQKLCHGERLQNNSYAFLMLLDDSPLTRVELAVHRLVCSGSGRQDAPILEAKRVDGSAAIQQESEMLKAGSIDQYLSQRLPAGILTAHVLRELKTNFLNIIDVILMGYIGRLGVGQPISIFVLRLCLCCLPSSCKRRWHQQTNRHKKK